MGSVTYLCSYVAVLVLLVAYSLPGARCDDCPVPHECKSFGLEPLSTGTGEAAFCFGVGAAPVCPGIDVDGNVYVPSTSTTSPATTTTATTTTTTLPITITTTVPTTTTVKGPPTSPITTPKSTPTTTTSKPPSDTTTTLTPPTPSPTTNVTTPPTTAITTPPTTTTTTPPTTAITTPPTTAITTPPTMAITTPPTTTTATPPCQNANCSGKSIGVYAHQNCDCRKYYVCQSSVLGGDVLVVSEYRCTGGYVFDPQAVNCVATTSNCPYQ